MKFLTSMFHWTPEEGLFSQELSSLNVKPSQCPFHQIYPDACDEGVVLISQVTGKEATYYVSSVDTDETREDIYGWNLLPTPETVRQQPRLKNTKILIIND